MKHRFLSRFVVLSVLLMLIFSAFGVTPARAAGRCYVNDDATGANTGASWTNAYTSLQSALADTCTEIWVAAGTYKPTTGTSRTATFQLENGVRSIAASMAWTTPRLQTATRPPTSPP